MKKINIRKCTFEDAYAIEYVAAHSWKETYTGFMPEAYLNNRIDTIEEKIERAKKNIRIGNYYVAEVDSQVVGILNFKISENEKFKNYGYLESLYILKEFQKLGIGKRLFQVAITKFIEMGINVMYLECLSGNNAIDFYKHYQGRVIDNIDFPIKDFNVKADVIIFDNLKNILKCLLL